MIKAWTGSRAHAYELRKFTQEPARTMRHNVCAMARLIVPGDLDLAGQDNTKPRATLPSLDSGAPTSKERTSPKRRTPSISSGWCVGNICSLRVSMIDGVRTEIMCVVSTMMWHAAPACRYVASPCFRNKARVAAPNILRLGSSEHPRLPCGVSRFDGRNASQEAT
jgi:hypothetical protein